MAKQIFSPSRYNELSDSIREHLEEKIEELMEERHVAGGGTQAARREFGNVTLIEERSREVWQWPRLESFLAGWKAMRSGSYGIMLASPSL